MPLGWGITIDRSWLRVSPGDQKVPLQGYGEGRTNLLRSTAWLVDSELVEFRSSKGLSDHLSGHFYVAQKLEKEREKGGKVRWGEKWRGKGKEKKGLEAKNKNWGGRKGRWSQKLISMFKLREFQSFFLPSSLKFCS